MQEFDLILVGAGNSADVYRAANAAGLLTASAATLTSLP